MTCVYFLIDISIQADNYWFTINNHIVSFLTTSPSDRFIVLPVKARTARAEANTIITEIQYVGT